jgi:hypothetical protein
MIFLSCNNGDETDTFRGGEKDPPVIQPPSDAITDPTRLVNDSMIVPDVTPGNGKPVGESDSIQLNKH